MLQRKLIQQPTTTLLVTAMSCATAAGERHAIRAKKFPGDFQHVNAAAALAGGVRVVLGWLVGVGHV
jgi:hypothetical protein